MARTANRLTARTATTLGAGFHGDGGGLYLRGDSGGSRRWVFLFRYRSKRCEMGLGPLADFPLAKARELAQQARLLVKAGKNPIGERRRERAAVEAVPFGELAEQLITDLTPQWRNPVSAHRWRTTLLEDASALKAVPVDQVTTENVLVVLKPIWLAKPETAARLRGRIERVIDAAKAKGMREGENPARWMGHLSMLLPRQSVSRNHHAALHYDDIRPFFTYLRKSESISTVALNFTILTYARTNETLGAQGSEIDLQKAVWTIPADRTKPCREYRIPLSTPALAIARQRIELVGRGFLFPGLKLGRPLSNMAMSKMLKLLGRGDITVHGFRSTFKEWASDRTAFPREIIEQAMGHLVGDAAEQAYRRSDALERRRALLDAWAAYCEPTGGAQIITLSA